MKRTVVFYRTAAGCPFENFLDSLPGKIGKKIIWILRACEELENAAELYFKGAGLHGMQECLVTCEGADFRVFGFFHREEMVVLAGGLCSDFRDVEEDAGRLNVGPGAVSRMENRAGDMRLSDLMGAARLFGKTARILFE